MDSPSRKVYVPHSLTLSLIPALPDPSRYRPPVPCLPSIKASSGLVLVPMSSPTISTLYLLGFAISFFQLVSASLLRPLFPPEEGAGVKPGKNVPTPAGYLCAISVMAGITSSYWLLLMYIARRKTSPDWARAGLHVTFLVCTSLHWIYLTVMLLCMNSPSSPLWTLIYSCADAGFAGNRCAAIALHLYLPLVDILVLLSTAWIVFHRARAVHGSDKVTLSPTAYAAAWTLGHVGELGVAAVGAEWDKADGNVV
ncbi:hypothetical protein DFH07DRAFT_1062556 [Mycena maculata]|uniref:Uncharacterized protein n=1 Tax=Mycena maculata TaxID=230809 RepID=A0AAD7ITE8_9AGAR|nr:hypothetical protein DFH07DRAFT_1062556 [Mycena maculata]